MSTFIHTTAIIEKPYLKQNNPPQCLTCQHVMVTHVTIAITRPSALNVMIIIIQQSTNTAVSLPKVHFAPVLRQRSTKGTQFTIKKWKP